MVTALTADELRALVAHQVHHDRGLRDAVERSCQRGHATDDAITLSAVLKRQLDALLSALSGGRDRPSSMTLIGALEHWIEDVGRQLIPRVPEDAVALAERLITSEPVFYNELADVDWEICELIRAACLLWLDAAAACGGDPGRWLPRLLALYRSDDYGHREALLSEAARLIDRATLCALADDLKIRSQLRSVEGDHRASRELQRQHELIAQALGAPDRPGR